MRIFRTIITFRNILAVTALGSALFVFSPLASATVITWELEGVTFAGGETASGWFQVDTSSPGVIAWNLAFGGLPSYDPATLVGTSSTAYYGPGGSAVGFDDPYYGGITVAVYPEGNGTGNPFVFIVLNGPSIPLYDEGNYVDPLIADVSESSIFYGRIGGPLTKLALTAGEFVQASGARINICPAGANGRGGDYNPTKASCDLGAIVLNGDTFCPAGANGPFSIYNPTKAYCDLGLIVPIGYQVCSPQPGGFQHEIYDPFIASCEDGVIVPLFPPLGDVECSPGLLGLGGFYSTEHSYCDFGIIVPLGFSYCIPGAYGPGGFYQTSAGGSCDRGVVVPKGDSYCAPGPNGLGGIYQPSAGQSCDKGKIQSSP